MDAHATPRPLPRRALIVARGLLAPYLVLLGLVVFLPARETERVTGLVAILADVLAAFGVAREPAASGLEFLANVALFVPFGLLLPIAFPNTPGFLVVQIGCLLSVGIELVQVVIPSRVPAVSDVIANTIGVAVGLGIVRLGLRRRGRRRSTAGQPSGRQ